MSQAFQLMFLNASGIQAALKAYGKVDVLVNNAGIMPIARFAALKVDEWEKMIDINIKGVLFGIAAALPVFTKVKSGHFINVSSVAGIKVFATGGSVYSGTKFAVHVWAGSRPWIPKGERSGSLMPTAITAKGLSFGQMKCCQHFLSLRESRTN